MASPESRTPPAAPAVQCAFPPAPEGGSPSDQRQWLMSRVQKLHAVKDQLQLLRGHSSCEQPNQEIQSAKRPCVLAGGKKFYIDLYRTYSGRGSVSSSTR